MPSVNGRGKRGKKRGRPFRFSTFIAEMREKNNLSRVQLARRVGVSVSSIANWETGSSKPTDGNIVNIAEALSFDPDELRALMPKQAKGAKVKTIKAIRKSLKKPVKASNFSSLDVDAETLKLAQLLAEARRQGFSVNVAVRKRMD